MTAPLAAKKMPPLAPGEFRFVTKAISIEPPGEDGRRRFKVVMSSTVVDEGNDEIKMSALEDLRRDFAGGLNIFTDHEHKVDNVFGRSDYADIRQAGMVDPKTGFPVYDLHVAGVVNTPNPRMVQLADSIDGGFVTFGASIGARVREHKRNKAGGIDIYHLSGKEGSLVGIPMNQRSWTYKAAKAANQLDEIEDSVWDDEEDEVEKGTLDAGARSDLDADQFACPEKRKYPINDKAHVRAALSRIADPSNDQCGRDKILAAARRMGIGDHGDKKAASMSDDDLLTWALDTEGGSALQTQGLCDSCGHQSDCDCATCDCGGSMHTQNNTKSLEDLGLEIKTEDETPAVDADVQESAEVEETPEETPETPAAEEGEDETTDPPTEEKAFTFAATDVVELAGHVRELVKAVSDRDDEIVTLKAERDQLADENEEAKKLIEKVLAMPLRPKAVADVADLNKKLPDFLAPEVKEFLTKSAGDNR
jgi:hypothetical protein